MGEKGWVCTKCKSIYRTRERAETCGRYHLNELPGYYVPLYQREFRQYAESMGTPQNEIHKFITEFGSSEVDMRVAVRYLAIGRSFDETVVFLENGVTPDDLINGEY